MRLTHPLTGQTVEATPTETFPANAYYRADSTGFEWLHPVPPGGAGFPDFSAYADTLLTGATADAIRDASPVFEHAAFAWARANLPPRANVVELFAETGRFAWRLRDAGFNVRLVDPVPNHVAVLRRHGFPAACGDSAGALPPDDSPADAVFILESLIRVATPRQLLEGIRLRFPGARIYVTAPSLRRPLKLPDVAARVGYPPDFLCRWTVPALRRALELSGYTAAGAVIRPRLLAPTTLKRRFVNAAFATLLRINGEYEFSVSAWGKPAR